MNFSYEKHGRDAEFKHSLLSHANDVPVRPVLNIAIIAFCLAYIVWFYFSPSTAFTAIFKTVAWLSVGFAVLRGLAFLTPKPKNLGLAEISDDLPNYTVLVPLFHEAQMVEQIVQGLSAIRYPKRRLEILLITEAVDPFTAQAVEKMLTHEDLESFRHVIVPPGTPQTKPRALNYAMQSAHGEYVTIYDAEDRPHPDQLLAAIKAFKHRPNWAAVQAPLDYFNHDDNWLTRQFSLEYAVLFHVWIPFLVRIGLPFPLGGTSNHMRRTALDEVMCWDPHNVTEDADLSFRLAAHGHQIGFIHPPTQEEAVSSLHAWTYQRARWMKGYIQTWDVHMSEPFAPGGLQGILRFITLQLTLGTTLLSVLFYTPVVIGLPLIAIVLFFAGVPIDISLTYSLTFVFSICVGCVIGLVGAHRSGKSRLIRSAAFMPIYWVLLFKPVLIAFREMRSRQRFHWHKTKHGVSRPVDPLLSTKPKQKHVPLRRPLD